MEVCTYLASHKYMLDVVAFGGKLAQCTRSGGQFVTKRYKCTESSIIQLALSCIK